MHTMLRICCLLLLCLTDVYASETLTLEPGQASPKANIEQLSWLAGH